MSNKGRLPKRPINPDLFAKQGDAVMIELEATLVAPISGTAANGEIVVRLPKFVDPGTGLPLPARPSPGQVSHRSFNLTPETTANLLADWVCEFLVRKDGKLPLADLSPDHFKSDSGTLVYGRAVWFFDTFWKGVAHAISQLVNRHDRPWQVSSTAMRMLGRGSRLRSYADVGLRTLLDVHDTLLGKWWRRPNFELSARPRANDEKEYSTFKLAGGTQRQPQYVAELDRRWAEERQDKWAVESANYVASRLPASLNRLRVLGTVDEQTFDEWREGLKIEAQATEDRQRRSSPAPVAVQSVPKVAVPHTKPPPGTWSSPMSKKDMMVIMSAGGTPMGRDAFKTWSAGYELEPVNGNRQLWRIRLDGMTDNERAKFEPKKTQAK